MAKNMGVDIEALRASVPPEFSPKEDAKLKEQFAATNNAANAPDAAFDVEPVELATDLLGGEEIDPEQAGRRNAEVAAARPEPGTTPDAPQVRPQPSTDPAQAKAEADEAYHDAVGAVHQHEAVLEERLREQSRNIGDGNDDKSVDSGFRAVNVSGHEVAEAGRKKRGKEARRATERQMMLMHMMQNGQMGDYMANEVFSNMSDADFAKLRTEIEAETGKPLEEHAADVLGEDIAARRPDESVAEYNERIITALGKDAFDPNTGEIKEEYKGTALGNAIENNEDYQRVLAETEPLVEKLRLEGDTPENLQEVELQSDKSTAQADVLASQLDEVSTEATDIARVSQDGHTDDNTLETASKNSSGFGSLNALAMTAGGDLTTSASALDRLTLTDDFNTASRNTGTQQDLTLAQSATPQSASLTT